MNPTIDTEEVWKLLSSRLGRFIRARVRDDSTASDLLQETFLRIHKKLGTLEDEERLPAWVFQIARNVIVDHYRSRKNPSDAAIDPPSRPDSDNLNEIVSGWIPGAIESLPESYRDVVKLYELDDLPQREIAQQLGLSLTAVKSRSVVAGKSSNKSWTTVVPSSWTAGATSSIGRPVAKPNVASVPSMTPLRAADPY